MISMSTNVDAGVPDPSPRARGRARTSRHSRAKVVPERRATVTPRSCQKVVPAGHPDATLRDGRVSESRAAGRSAQPLWKRSHDRPAREPCQWVHRTSYSSGRPDRRTHGLEDGTSWDVGRRGRIIGQHP